MKKIRMSGLQIARRLTLGLILVSVTVITYLHQRMPGIPPIDALCPFGGLETLMAFAANGGLLEKIQPGNLVLLGGIILLGVVLARFFCGWFCAFGALQAIFGSLGRKIFGRHFTVPVKVDRVLRLVKYPLLALILFQTWRAGTLLIRPFDPFATYAHLPSGLANVWAEFAVGFVILIATLVLSMLYERAFCKYLCPLGAFNALLGRIPLFRIKRSASTCIGCAKCDRVCPMNIDISGPLSIDSPECIGCLECVTVCPTKPSSLDPTLAGKNIKPSLVVILGFALFLVAAVTGQALDLLHFVPPSLSARAAAGQLRVEDIKGSSTYAMVASSFGIELERLYESVGIRSEQVPPDTMIKETGKLAGIKDFETDAVRLAVAKIIGVPYAGEGAEPAFGDLIAEDACATCGSASEEGKILPPVDFELEGIMSIDDVASSVGMKASEVISVLGLPADFPTDKPLRDLRSTYGYTMTELKDRMRKALSE